MTPFERIAEMFWAANRPDRRFPATIFYNEGWLLRLVLDWFSRQCHCDEHPLSFALGARWFSEALLPSQFFAHHRSDRLAEGWTHADGVVGHVTIGDSGLANAALANGPTQLVVTEAKLFSRLSSGVTNASYFDQAARNVACMAQMLFKVGCSPERLPSLAFLVLAPSEQIQRNVFTAALSKESIRNKVQRRVEGYQPPHREPKEQWQRAWFLPTLERMQVACLPWEDVIEFIQSRDPRFGSELLEFYDECLRFNRAQEPEQVSVNARPEALVG
jgi:hypothetical protein